MDSANGLGKSADPPNFTIVRAPSLISSKISRCCPNTKAKPMLISSFPECEINRFSPTWCILLHYELG